LRQAVDAEYLLDGGAHLLGAPHLSAASIVQPERLHGEDEFFEPAVGADDARPTASRRTPGVRPTPPGTVPPNDDGGR
jgi:hypothetical protein